MPLITFLNLMLPNLKAFIAIFEPINHFNKITYQVDWCIEASLDHSEFYTFLEAPPQSKSRLLAHTVIPEMHKSGYFHILWCNKNYSCTEWLNECNIHFTLSTYINTHWHKLWRIFWCLTQPYTWTKSLDIKPWE